MNYHVRKKMVSKVFVSFRLEKLINVLLRAESVCLQSTPLVSIFYLCHGFSRNANRHNAKRHYAYLRYAYLGYAYLRYAFSRYAYLRYTYLRYAFCVMPFRVCLFTLCFFALCLLPLSMPFCILTSCMIHETGFCPSASV